MEHGVIERVGEQSDTQLYMKIEKEKAIQSTVYDDIEMNMNYIQGEPELMEPVKSDAALSEKKEVVEDGWRDIADLQCAQGASSLAIVDRANLFASSVDLGNILNIKEDLGAIDIGPTVLQHMDRWYTTNQTQVSGEYVDVCELKIDPILCGGVQEEIIEDEWRVQTGDGLVLPASFPTPRDSLMEQLGTFTALNSLHKECLETIRTVQLWRPDTFQCDVCDAVYIDAHQLFQHVQEVHGPRPRRSLHQHVISPQISKEGQRCATGSKPLGYICDFCQKKFTAKHAMRNHISWVHASGSYECSQCVKIFKCKRYLLSHKAKVHTAGSHPQLYRCSQCPKTCNSVRSLDFHRLCVHVNESHKCAKCGKEFKSKAYLQRHVLYVHAEERHECAVCMTICKSKGAFKRHVQRVHAHKSVATSPVVYTCVYCHKTYASKSGLISHIDVVHSQVRYTCSECNKDYASKLYLRRHMKLVHSKEEHEGSGSICDYCKKMFTNKNGLQRHIAHQHASGHYECHHCNKMFKCKEYLILHTARVHTAAHADVDGERRLQATSTRAIAASMNVATGSVVMNDELSMKLEWEDSDLDIGPTVLQHMDMYYRPVQLDMSLVEQGSIIINSYNNPLPWDGVKEKIIEDEWRDAWHSKGETRPEQRARSRLYGCDKCAKTFEGRENFYLHYKHVHGTGFHECTECNKKYNCKAYLDRHINSVHSKQQHAATACTICNKTYKSKQSLREHAARCSKPKSAAVTGQAQYKLHSCDECMKTYIYKESLKQHNRNIHGKESHKCTECNKTFSSKAYLLYTHITNVHGKQQYECKVCKKVYKSKPALSMHVHRVHRPRPAESHQLHACTNCGKNFNLKQYLRRHEKRGKCKRAVVSTSRQRPNVAIVKEEPAEGELDLGPTVFQHMDCNYRPYEQKPELN